MGCRALAGGAEQSLVTKLHFKKDTSKEKLQPAGQREKSTRAKTADPRSPANTPRTPVSTLTPRPLPAPGTVSAPEGGLLSRHPGTVAAFGSSTPCLGVSSVWQTASYTKDPFPRQRCTWWQLSPSDKGNSAEPTSFRPKAEGLDVWDTARRTGGDRASSSCSPRAAPAPQRPHITCRSES